MRSDANTLTVRSAEDIQAHVQQVWRSIESLQQRIATLTAGDARAFALALKFEPIGQHPVLGHPLNAIEQVNQAWTYLVALAAARQLLVLHRNAGGFRLAPGAHATQDLDVMSEIPGLVGAETFASVDPANNKKLATDRAKLAGRTEQHRYVFFASPRFPGLQRREQLERPTAPGVQVWSVDV